MRCTSFVLMLAIAVLSGRADEISFNRDIRPVLSDKCFTCHGPDENHREGGLRLDQQDSALAEGDSGERPIVPGNVSASEVFRRIISDDPDERMPPADSNKELTPDEVALIRQWIEQGAEYQSHWSFLPIAKITPPPTTSNWVIDDIDRFVLSRLEREGLKPTPPADRRTLIRRVTLDLTGLPPTPSEVDAFVDDPNSISTAYEKLVDRLLASPRYGEHFASEWLDAARYADSDGYESDPLRNMWPWRDWVVWALNDNMPYDQFIIEQLAGDMLPDATIRQRLATGFNRNHRLNNEGGILPEEWLVEYVADRTETTAVVFMGLTWGCARCHDHKYDPQTQRDYYRMFAFFHNLPEKGSARGSTNAAPMMNVPRLSAIEDYESRIAPIAALQAELTELSQSSDVNDAIDQWREQLDAEQQAKLPKEIAEVAVAKWNKKQRATARNHFVTTMHPSGVGLQKQLSVLEKQQAKLLKTGANVMVMADMPEPRQTHILIRGAYDQPGQQVTAGTPSWLPPMDEALPKNRLGLARWLVDRRHPLTARVAVNRFWSHYFGVGLVKTQDDFGAQGEPPSHPDLLDHLALQFINSDWNAKSLHKRIVMSATYRQSARASSELFARDPENRLLARGPRYRLSAAVIRDQALAVSGLLVEQPGGPPVKPYQVDGLWREIIKGGPTYKRDAGDKLYRRSLYTLWRRAVKPPLMLLLDANQRDTCQVTQQRTNTPLQALLLMNEITFVEAARGLAARLIIEGGQSQQDRVDFGVRLVTSRTPTDAELQILTEELKHNLQSYRSNPEAAKQLIAIGESTPPAELDPAELAAYTALSRLLLNLDETVTKQ
jgi:hypothetical protein